MGRTGTIFLWCVLVFAVVSASVLAAYAPFIAAALACGVVAFLATFHRPKTALVAWLLSLAFIPPWVSLDMGVSFPALTFVGAMALMGNRAAGLWRPKSTDWVLLTLIVICGVAVQLGDSSSGLWAAMITQWLLAYLVGKSLTVAVGLQFTAKAIVAVFSIVAALALVEFAAAWHPFTELAFPNGAYETWSEIQTRGGLDRSEWAMGHSIALGGMLALTLPFVFRTNARMPRVLLASALIMGASVVTFSRGSIFSVALVLIIAAFLLPQLKIGLRILIVVVVAAGASSLASRLASVFEGGEVQSSTLYRAEMMSALAGTMSPLGRAGSAQASVDGEVVFSGFASIDSAFLHIGLNYGWIPMLIFIGYFVPIIPRVLAGKANIAEVALLCQVPLLFTVAFITQYQSFFWFIAGVAVAARSMTPQPVVTSKSSRQQLGRDVLTPRLRQQARGHTKGFAIR